MVPGDGVGIAVRAFLAGITDAGVVQLTEEACRRNIDEDFYQTSATVPNPKMFSSDFMLFSSFGTFINSGSSL